MSVITVEYDIREDAPEGTEVFALEPSSVELIENWSRVAFWKYRLSMRKPLRSFPAETHGSRSPLQALLVRTRRLQA